MFEQGLWPMNYANLRVEQVKSFFVHSWLSYLLAQFRGSLLSDREGACDRVCLILYGIQAVLSPFKTQYVNDIAVA